MAGEIKNLEEGNVPDQLPMTKEDARARVMMVLQEISVLGANDYEFGAIRKILDGLDADEIKPEEAVEEANKIKNNKEEYR